jgi:hypothetical protein
MKHGMAMILVTLVALAGCGGDKGKGTTTPDETGGGDTGEGTGGEGAVVVTNEPEIPTEGDPEDHFLGHGNLFAGFDAYSQGSLYLEAVKQISPPGSTGKGLYKQVRTGNQIETQFAWTTHKAKPEEIQVGVVALISDRKDDQGMYVAPTTVEQAYDYRWWAARIVSLVALESKGYVWVAGGYKVAPDAVRILEGEDSAALTVEGEEDAHFVQSGHWFAGHNPLPEKNTAYVQLSVPASPFDGGTGKFMSVYNGVIIDTAHAWQTKIAKKKDVKVGVHVLVPDIKDGGVYRAPKTRHEALFNRWWFAKVEKKKKTTVMVSGGYEVNMDALRTIQ